MTSQAQTPFTIVQATPAVEDWETAFSNRKAIPDIGDWLAGSTRRSAAFVDGFEGRKELGRPYAQGDRRFFDVFEPVSQPKGTLIFIHGGYWRATAASDYHCFAAGALQRGWRVVMPDYPLCPSVSIRDIANGITTAIDAITQAFPDGPMILSGHSAGGHLASFAVSATSGLAEATRARIGRVVSLSGLHDLRPLLHATQLNSDLRLTLEEAAALSPALSQPGHLFELMCICGGGELPEFRRQNRLLADIWSGFGIATSAIECGTLDHFRILDLITDPDQPLTRALTGE